MLNSFVCDVCGFTTENGKILSNHKRWKHIAGKGSQRYSDCIEKLKKSRVVERITKDFICPICGKTFTITNTESYFNSKRFLQHSHCCSSSCAHTRSLSDETKQKLSAYAKDHPTGFASPDFVQKGTRKNHSKRELEIVDYLKANFPDDDWKQGFVQGKTKYNGCYLNPDIHSNKLHVVIEYDGIWHFKDINGQLAYKQAVDRAMTNWCKENNYKLIRIDEELNITNAQIVDAIYNNNSQLILFNSKRYDYLNLN